MSTPLEPYNPYTADPVLRRAVAREGGAGADDDLRAFGQRVGSGEVSRWGFEANRHGPELVTHDRFGDRIDEVDYHPSYHSAAGAVGLRRAAQPPTTTSDPRRRRPTWPATSRMFS